MANESSEVRAYGDGSLYVADVGTAFPATIDAVVDTGDWSELGFLTEDGVTPEFGQETKDVGAWQSGDPVRILLTKKPKSVAFNMLQTNRDTLALALGGGDFTTSGTGWQFEPADESFLDQRALIVEARDGDYTYRIMYRKAQREGAVKFDFKRTDATAFSITMRILAADGGLKPFLIQTDDPAFDLGS